MNDVVLETWFPTHIGYAFNPHHDKMEQDLVDHCKQIQKTVEPGGEHWLSKSTYNTSDGKYDLFLDDKFTYLNKWIHQQVTNYAEQLKIKKNFQPHCSWFNIYEKGDFQEYHTHTGLTISTIYFLKGGSDGARVFFKSPRNDMLYIEYEEMDKNNFGTVYYAPQPGKLLIFTSDIHHAVEKHTLDEERITISHNFIQERS